MHYLIIRDGSGGRQWWNEDADCWGTRQAATRYHYPPNPYPNVAGGRWVGPMDGSES